MLRANLYAFSSADKPEVSEEQLKKQLIPLLDTHAQTACNRCLASPLGIGIYTIPRGFPRDRISNCLKFCYDTPPRMPLGPTALPRTLHRAPYREWDNLLGSAYCRDGSSSESLGCGLEKEISA